MSEGYDCFLIGKQEAKEAPYLIFCSDRSIAQKHYLANFSEQSLKQLLKDDTMHVHNIVYKDGCFWSDQNYESLAVQAPPTVLPVTHAPILWDYLYALILDDAVFTLPDSSKTFSFSDIAFSMKSDLVTVSSFEKNKYNTYVIYDTPSIYNPELQSLLKVRCSDKLYYEMFSTYQSLEHTGKYITFLIDLRSIPCIWSTKYCVLRFYPEELSYLMSAYNLLKSKATGLDIGYWLQGYTDQLYTFIKNKNKELSVESKVSFHTSMSMVNTNVLAEILQKHKDYLAAICKTGNILKLKLFIADLVPGVQLNAYFNKLCEGILDAYSLAYNKYTLKDYQALITTYACRIFKYKMACNCQLLELPQTIDFLDGKLNIRGGVQND